MRRREEPGPVATPFVSSNDTICFVMRERKKRYSIRDRKKMFEDWKKKTSVWPDPEASSIADFLRRVLSNFLSYYSSLSLKQTFERKYHKGK